MSTHVRTFAIPLLTVLAVVSLVSLGLAGTATADFTTTDSGYSLVGCSPWVYNGCCAFNSGTEFTKDCRYCNQVGDCYDERQTDCRYGGCIV